MARERHHATQSMLATRFIGAGKSRHVDHRGEIRRTWDFGIGMGGSARSHRLRCHASCGQVAQRDCESMLTTRFICARKSRHLDHRGEIRQRSAAVTFAVRAHTPHQRKKYESWLVEEILTNVRRSTAGPSLNPT